MSWIMDITTIVLLIVLVLFLAVVVLLFLLFSNNASTPASGQVAVSSNLRSLVAAQRARTSSNEHAKTSAFESNLALAAAAETNLSRKKSLRSSQMTLEKKLRYAKLPLTPIQVRLIQVIFTVISFIVAFKFAEKSIQIMVVILAPKLIMAVIDSFMNKRFKAFDDDYPVLLMSYVSLLKTGMGSIGGLEAAAKGLDEGSLVRSEIELLIERLRLGLTEEQAIGAFGEDIAHPELELFVQGLILSRRVGGSLSATLERLAKQVRKRQQFRKQAVAAVGMEQSSLYAVAAIMTALMIYLAISSPELVEGAFKKDTGKMIFQGGLALIVFGFWWSKQVTKIKV